MRNPEKDFYWMDWFKGAVQDSMYQNTVLSLWAGSLVTYVLTH